MYRNPIERTESLARAYAETAPPHGTFQALHATQRDAYRAQAKRLTRIVGRRGTGIEVGSYVAGFLAAARDEGWRFTGVDVNADAVAFARNLGFEARVGTIEDMAGGAIFLASRAGDYVVGTPLPIDGGIVNAWVPENAIDPSGH